MRNQDMTPEEIYGIALHEALKMGFGQNSSDVAQQVCLNRLEGLGKNQWMRFSVIDAAGHLGLSIGGKEHRTYATDPSDRTIKNQEAKPAPVVTDKDFERMVIGLESRDRAIFTLYFRWGFFLWEVAQVFGISESRASQKIEEITRRVKGNLNPLREDDSSSYP